MRQVADDAGRSLRDYHTTLLLSVQLDGLVGAAQVGDGAVVMGGRDAYVLLTTPHRGGEYANETSFITEARGLAEAQVEVRYGGAARLAMFSDGIQDLVLDYTGDPSP